MGKTIKYALLTCVITVWTGCGDRAETTNPSSDGTSPVPSVESRPPVSQTFAGLADADEAGGNWGTFDVRHVTTRSGNDAPDADLLPPFNIWLKAAEDGQLSGLRMNHRSLEPGDLGVVRGTIIGDLGGERGPGSIQDRAQVVLYCDYDVRYEHLIDVITAVSGIHDRRDKIVVLIKNIGITPSGTTPPDPLTQEIDTAGDPRAKTEPRAPVPEFPLDVDQPYRIELPKSEIARPPEIPYEEPIGVDVTRSGMFLLHGERLSLNDLPDRMNRQRLVLKSMGKTQDEATIVIRADKDCPAGRIQEMIETCHGQGFEHFALLANQEPWY